MASLALLAAALAISVPLVIRRLRTRAPAVEAAARRAEDAVARGLDAMGELAATLPLRGDALPGAAPAALPDALLRAPGCRFDSGEGFPASPGGPPIWRDRRRFSPTPLFPPRLPWCFDGHRPWGVGSWRRK